MTEAERIVALKREIADLRAAAQRCLTHFERIRDPAADPFDTPMMVQLRMALRALK